MSKKIWIGLLVVLVVEVGLAWNAGKPDIAQKIG